MFSLKDISELAEKIERNGEHLYRRAKRAVKDPQLRALLNWLADEEQRHAQWFSKLNWGNQEIDPDAEMAKMGRALLVEMVGEQTFSLDKKGLESAGTINKIVSQAIEFEKDTIIFYGMLRDFIKDRTVQEQLDIIIAEEHSHVDKLSAFLDQPQPEKQERPQ